MQSIQAVRADGSGLQTLYIHKYASGNDGNPPPLYFEEIIAWVSDHTFIATTEVFESMPHDLREVNLEAGTQRVLLDGQHCGAELDSNSGTMFVNVCKSFGILNGPAEGIFRFTLDDLTLRPVILLENEEESLNLGSWDPTLGAFNVYCLTSGSGPHERIAYSPDGEQIEIDPRYVFPSPDGQWVVEQGEDTLIVRMMDGEVVREFARTGEVYWQPDSSALFVIRGPTLVRYAADQNWAGVTVSEWMEGSKGLVIVTR